MRFYGTYARTVSPEGQFIGGVPVLALGSTLLWQGMPRLHDCDACSASGVAELLYTTGLLALVPVSVADNGASFEFEPTQDTPSRLNMVGPAPEEAHAAAVIEWKHDHRCAPPSMSDAEIVARARTAAAMSGGHCRRARIPNCELARLLDMLHPEPADDGELVEVLEHHECYLADGFAAALIGWGERFHDTFAVYDRRACIKILVGRGMGEEEAEEFFTYNTVGAWVGPGTPAFVTLRRAS